MATSATPVQGAGSTGNCRGWDIVATDDAAELLEITHGISFLDGATDGDRRCRVMLEATGLLFYTQQWVKVAVSGTTLQLSKTGTALGSGDAASHCRVWLEYLGCPFQ